MMIYFFRRITLFVITIAFISIITFSVFQVIPGDPVRIMLGPEADEVQVTAMQKKLGVDRPLYVQYLDWIKGVFSGDLGESIRFSRPVAELIRDRLPVTLSLALIAIFIVVVIAIPLGIFFAKRQNKWSDLFFSSLTQLGMAIPSFWLGMLIILYIGMTFRFFTVGEYVPWSMSISGALGSFLLPALTIAIPQIAVTFRYVRNAVLEELQRDYVWMARGKGISELFILLKHVLRNSMIPIVTVFGLIFAEIVGGTIIVEQVFGLPGIGNLLITSISYRDFPLVQGVVMYISLTVVIINFLVDVLYAVLDPQIRLR